MDGFSPKKGVPQDARAPVDGRTVQLVQRHARTDEHGRARSPWVSLFGVLVIFAALAWAPAGASAASPYQSQTSSSKTQPLPPSQNVHTASSSPAQPVPSVRGPHPASPSSSSKILPAQPRRPAPSPTQPPASPQPIQLPPTAIPASAKPPLWRLPAIVHPDFRELASRTLDEFWQPEDQFTALAMQHAGLPPAQAQIACAHAEVWSAWPPSPVARISEPCIQSLAADPNLMYRDIEERTFEYFWNTADPVTGLSPDHWPSPGPSSIAAVGFALTADVIGASRGYVSRQAAAQRVLQVLTFLLSRPQGPGPSGYSGYHGFFYHFLDMHTGLRYRDSELSTIDTALLMAGVLTAETYFDQSNPTEQQLRTVADQLYRRVNWGWAAPGVNPLVSMDWYPRKGFSKARWAGFNEASILYILGMGSPTYPLRNNAWTAWTATTEADWRNLDGQTLLAFGAQFVFQYTAVWIDLRGIADPLMRAHGENYFLNGRRATLAQRQYAIDNPEGWAGYGPNIWGLTACNGPGYVRALYHGQMRQFYGYAARGITSQDTDDGTLAPTAVLGSLPFAPEYVTQATQALLRQYGDILYTQYGFFDSFNPSFTDPRLAQDGFVVPGRGWVDNEFLGIDQGPIVAMIENERSGLIWRIMRTNPYVRAGLQRAEFSGAWFDPTPLPTVTPPANPSGRPAGRG